MVNKKKNKKPKTQKEKDRINDPNYILNPGTGRWVLKKGKIGKLILEDIKKQEKKVSEKSPENDLKKEQSIAKTPLISPVDSSIVDVEIPPLDLNENNNNLNASNINQDFRNYSYDNYYEQSSQSIQPTTKNPPPSSVRISSDEWSLLYKLEPNIQKLALKILFEETMKYESGSSSYPSIDFVVCLSMDRIKGVEKEEKRKRDSEERIRKEKEDSEKDDLDNMTEKEKLQRAKVERLKWLSRFDSDNKNEQKL